MDWVALKPFAVRTFVNPVPHRRSEGTYIAICVHKKQTVFSTTVLYQRVPQKFSSRRQLPVQVMVERREIVQLNPEFRSNELALWVCGPEDCI